MKPLQTMAEALEVLQDIKALRVKVRNEYNALRHFGAVGMMGERSHIDVRSVVAEAKEHAAAIREDRAAIAALDDVIYYRELNTLAVTLGLYEE
jgi:hypothetical protein